MNEYERISTKSKPTGEDGEEGEGEGEEGEGEGWEGKLLRDGTGQVETSKALKEVLADLKTKALACDGWGNKRLPEVFLVANSILQGTQELIHGPYVTFLSPRTAVMVIIWWSYHDFTPFCHVYWEQALTRPELFFKYLTCLVRKIENDRVPGNYYFILKAIEDSIGWDIQLIKCQFQ